MKTYFVVKMAANNLPMRNPVMCNSYQKAAQVMNEMLIQDKYYCDKQCFTKIKKWGYWLTGMDQHSKVKIVRYV